MGSRYSHHLRFMPGSRSASQQCPLATTVLLGAAFLNPLSDSSDRPSHEAPDLPGAGKQPAVRKPVDRPWRALQKLRYLVHTNQLAGVGERRFRVAHWLGLGDGCRWKLGEFDLELWLGWLGRSQSAALNRPPASSPSDTAGLR